MVCSPGGADQSVEVEVAEPVAELADVADEALFEGLGDGLGERRRPRGLVRSSRRSARFSKPLAMFHNRLAVLFRPWLPHLTGGRGGGGGDVDSYTDYDALEHVHVRKGERQRARGRINDFLSPLSFIACGH